MYAIRSYYASAEELTHLLHIYQQCLGETLFVITSYSIHYTKLYDGSGPGTDQGIGFDVSLIQDGQGGKLV